VVEDSETQYPLTPTSSDADRLIVTAVDVVDAAPLFIVIDGFDGAVLSTIFLLFPQESIIIIRISRQQIN